MPELSHRFMIEAGLYYGLAVIAKAVTERCCFTPDARPPSAPVRLSFAQLLKRVFDIDIAQCPQCGGTLTIIAAIKDPPVIAKILTPLGWSARAPSQSPTRSFDRLQMA